MEESGWVENEDFSKSDENSRIVGSSMTRLTAFEYPTG